MRKVQIAIALILFTAGACGPRQPAEPPPSPDDAAASGPAVLAGQDRAQMVEHTLARWSYLDTDGDKRLSKAEIAAVQPAELARSSKVGGLLTHADSDGDGAVTRAEAEAYANARFDRQDVDKDGRVSDAEFNMPVR